MLSENVLKRINQVDSEKEFEKLKWSFESSDAADSIKQEAIRELKARKTIYDKDRNSTPERVYEDIKAGMADIDDIN
jgi:hypothetical protein